MEIWNEHMFKPYNTKRFRNFYVFLGSCFCYLVKHCRIVLGLKTSYFRWYGFM
ncbi:hypothetical protein Hanom_Chr00s200495g01837801 [Helianthus anomalus]